MRFGSDRQAPAADAHWQYTFEPINLPVSARRLLAENRTNRTRRETVLAGRSIGAVEEVRRRMVCIVGHPADGPAASLPAGWFGPGPSLSVELHDAQDGFASAQGDKENGIRVTIDGVDCWAARLPAEGPGEVIPGAGPVTDPFGPWEWQVILRQPPLELDDSLTTIVIRGRGWPVDTPLVSANVGAYLLGRTELLNRMRESAS